MMLLFPLFIFCCFLVVFAEKCKCGLENSEPRVHGGEKVTFMKYPWMVFLMKEEHSGGLKQCGGAIINSLYILTAAHCLKKAKKITVGIGSIYGQSNNQMMDVESFFQHEEFKKHILTNDIGLIKMKKPFNWTNKVRPICLPPKDMDGNGTLYVAGWGLTENNEPSDILLETTVEEYDIAKCKESFPQLLPDTQFCASRMGHTTCKGDSGGPLWKHKHGNSFQIGITSFNNKKCGTSRAQVYTKVTAYIDWIKKHTVDSEYCEN